VTGLGIVKGKGGLCSSPGHLRILVGIDNRWLNSRDAGASRLLESGGVKDLA
jgi:hypothetical protein